MRFVSKVVLSCWTFLAKMSKILKLRTIWTFQLSFIPHLSLHKACYKPSLFGPQYCIYRILTAKSQTYQEYKMQPNRIVVPKPVTRFSSLCRPWLNSGTQIVIFRLFSSRTSQNRTNKNNTLQSSFHCILKESSAWRLSLNFYYLTVGR